MSAHPQLCLIEDDAIMGESLVDRFRLEGFDVDWHRAGEPARRAIARRRYDAVLSDIRLPDGDGGQVFLGLLRERPSDAPLPPFIFITGYGTIDRAVELMKAGAADYVTKPFDLDRLVERVRRLCEPHLPGDATVLGASAAMRRIAEAMPRLAAQAETLLIVGESGVGKEHVARLYHGSRLNDGCRRWVILQNGIGHTWACFFITQPHLPPVPESDRADVGGSRSSSDHGGGLRQSGSDGG
jgi:DNA-binding NtrC family response regulator